MEFEAGGKGLSFRIGPEARDALRVIAPGETITTPAVRLGHIRGTLDDAVQTMHEHIRRSVLPKPNSERAYRIQCGVPGDQGHYTGGRKPDKPPVPQSDQSFGNGNRQCNKSNKHSYVVR
ncbi:MAG: hypothetical protein HYX78_15690 [Armatimonadetes bacterium]|nr:hypothetical protein [Armatimonadota bacterium]